MLTTRRTLLASLAAAPAATLRRWAEIDRMIARGEVKGRLSKADLPTPALAVDLEAFEANVSKMAAHAKAAGRALRPHAKTHKCPEIARRLIRAGAVGACAAKISEAESLAAGGVAGLLITGAPVGRHRIERAVALARRHPETIFCVDDAGNARDLDAAAGAARVKLNVAIDLWIGQRTGILPGEPAALLAEVIARLPNLKLAGLQAYAGQASHTVGFENRKRVSREAVGPAIETRRLLEKKGIPCPLLTVGSTGTYNIDSRMDGVTELQPGSFIFMDVDYHRIGGADGPVYSDFKTSLTVIATVVSKPSANTAIIDAGFKAFATDRSFGPQARDGEGLRYAFAGDEHGRLDLAKAGRAVNLGDRLEFIVPHCDPTVNLYDRIFATRAEMLEAVWPITARGMSQ